MEFINNNLNDIKENVNDVEDNIDIEVNNLDKIIDDNIDIGVNNLDKIIDDNIEDNIEDNNEDNNVTKITNNNTINKSIQILSVNRIVPLVKQSGMNVCVISYGVSATNTVIDILETNGYKIRTEVYNRLLCHFPTYINLGIPIIYVYSHPIKSLLSAKRRGPKIWKVNQQKLTNNLNTILSDENLLQSMFNQFKSWTSTPRNDVLILKMRELFDPSVAQKIQKFLKKKNKRFSNSI